MLTKCRICSSHTPIRCGRRLCSCSDITLVSTMPEDGDMNTDAICPACNNADIKSNFSVSASQAAQSIVLPSGDFDRNQKLRAHIHSLWGADRCDIMTCRACGFGFSHPFVAGDAEFYNLANSDVSY